MLFQRLLARWDKFISNLLRLSRDTTSSGQGTPSVSCFYTMLGPRIAIVNEARGVRILTGLFTMRHYYDRDGKLIRRLPVRKEVKKGERLIIGTRRAYEAYCTSLQIHKYS